MGALGTESTKAKRSRRARRGLVLAPAGNLGVLTLSACPAQIPSCSCLARVYRAHVFLPGKDFGGKGSGTVPRHWGRHPLPTLIRLEPLSPPPAMPLGQHGAEFKFLLQDGAHTLGILPLFCFGLGATGVRLWTGSWCLTCSYDALQVSGTVLSTLQILAQVIHPTPFPDQETEAERELA